jgi:uncharacterized OB-fold protein
VSPDPRFPRDVVDLPKPRPEPTPTSAPFWSALDDDRVRLQRCDACGAWVYYPRARCPRCLSDRLAWNEVSGHGSVLTFTVARQPTARPFSDEVPQLLAVVELDEGVRMTTTLVDVEPDAITVGMPVVPVFDHGADGVTLLRFRPE